MAEAAAGHGLIGEQHGADHLETAPVQTLRTQTDGERIAHLQGGAEIGMAMHDRQGHRRRIAASPGKDTGSLQPETLETFLPGLMAPAEQLLEMNNAGGVGVAEAHSPLQRQPAGCLSGQPIP